MERKKLLAAGISIAALAVASFTAGSLLTSGGTHAADRGHQLGAPASIVTATPGAALVNESLINPPAAPQDPEGGSNNAGQSQQPQHHQQHTGNGNQGGQNNEPEPQPEPKGEEDEPLVAVQLPSVISVSPSNGTAGVSRDAQVTIKFSQSMDRQSVQKGFSMETNPFVLVLGEASPSFEWNDDSTVMTFKPAAPLPHGTQVKVGVAKTAKNAEGHALGTAFSSSYTVVKESTVTLRGQDANDGHVFAPPVAVFGSHVVSNGDIKVGTWSRGFLSFSLDKLPDDLIKITGAELKVYQLSAHADAYSNATGGLWAQSVFYGNLNAGAFSVKAFTFMGHPFTTLLSETAGMGTRSTDVTHMVQKDWSLRGEQNSLSQFRLMFAKENAGAGPDISITLRGSSAPNRYPTLTITYEHP